MESNNVIDFAVEKAKRTKLKDLDYPNEGPIPLGEQMINAVNQAETDDWKNDYHEKAIEDADNGE